MDAWKDGSRCIHHRWLRIDWKTWQRRLEGGVSGLLWARTDLEASCMMEAICGIIEFYVCLSEKVYRGLAIGCMRAAPLLSTELGCGAYAGGTPFEDSTPLDLQITLQLRAERQWT